MEEFNNFSEPDLNYLLFDLNNVEEALRFPTAGCGPDPMPGEFLKCFSTSVSFHVFNLFKSLFLWLHFSDF